MTRVERWLRRRPLVLGLFAAAALLVSAAVVIASSLNASHPEAVPFEAAKALVTLATGLVLGGLLKLGIDGHAERKAQRDDLEKRLDALIADMHINHDRLETTRLLVAANRSAKTYGERMRDVIDAHVVLLKIARTPGLGVLPPNRQDACHLESMLAYLVALQLEFEEHYKRVSNLQRYDEGVTRQRFSVAAKEFLAGDGGSAATAPSASQLAWDLLHCELTFPVLEDLCRRGEQYELKFLASCSALAQTLRDAKMSVPSRGFGDS
jgi:hypothetical protein